MKYPNNGLFSYCEQLGKALLHQKPPDCRLAFYIPEKQKGFFGKKEEYVIQNHLHKFFPKNVGGFNIWHCTFQGSNYFPAKRMRARVVATIHDLNFLHEGIPADQQNKHHKKVQQLIERADKIVAISNFVKKDIIDTFNVNSRKVEVIYHGHNKPAYSEFTQPSTTYNKPFFFALGTINRKKNFHVLPAMLLKNDYELIIAGGSAESDYEALIVETAGKLGVGDRVKIIGAITDSEKYWLYKNCEAFCLPSQAEGFGAPVLEAMQFGTPVILSKATSLPEIGGPHAFYFNDFSTDAVSRTAEDFLNRPITENIRTELINWAGQFDWDVAAKKYWHLYQNVLS
jgi:glycosyltransferase involved in cell wall biosynthesis